MKPAVDVKKLYATAFDSLDSFGRVLDELAQRRTSKASGGGPKGNGSAEPEPDACAEADSTPPESGDADEDAGEDTQEMGKPDEPEEDEEKQP